jgi:DNA recombination-dependent growth factor C
MNGEGFQELVLKKLEFLDTLANDVADIKKGQSNLDKIDASQIRMEGELTEIG